MFPFHMFSKIWRLWKFYSAYIAFCWGWNYRFWSLGWNKTCSSVMNARNKKYKLECSFIMCILSSDLFENVIPHIVQVNEVTVTVFATSTTAKCTFLIRIIRSSNLYLGFRPRCRTLNRWMRYHYNFHHTLNKM